MRIRTGASSHPTIRQANAQHRPAPPPMLEVASLSGTPTPLNSTQHMCLLPGNTSAPRLLEANNQSDNVKDPAPATKQNPGTTSAARPQMQQTEKSLAIFLPPRLITTCLARAPHRPQQSQCDGATAAKSSTQGCGCETVYNEWCARLHASHVAHVQEVQAFL